jgi:hypothetical protein
VFYARQDSKVAEPDSFAIRVRNVSANAAQTAAQGVSTAAQSAAVGVSKGVRQGVYVTRVWAAPRLESAAGYTTTTVAPKVSAALISTANQVRPVEVTQKKSHSVLMWSAVAAAVLAAASAATALVRYRYRAAMVEEEDDFGTVGQTGTSGTESSAPEGSAPADSTATSADTEVNGRVSTSGW